MLCVGMCIGNCDCVKGNGISTSYSGFICVFFYSVREKYAQK